MKAKLLEIIALVSSLVLEGAIKHRQFGKFGQNYMMQFTSESDDPM